MPGPGPSTPPHTAPTRSHAWLRPEGRQLPAGLAAGDCSPELLGKVLQVGFTGELIKKARKGESIMLYLGDNGGG